VELTETLGMLQATPQLPLVRAIPTNSAVFIFFGGVGVKKYLEMHFCVILL